jgi:hypothetical protein
MKDVATCDKLRGAGKQALLLGDVRMGKPVRLWRMPYPDYIGMGGVLGELKHLSTRRKRKKIYTLSSGERKGYSLNFFNWFERCLLLRGSSAITARLVVVLEKGSKTHHEATS